MGRQFHLLVPLEKLRPGRPGNHRCPATSLHGPSERRVDLRAWLLIACSGCIQRKAGVLSQAFLVLLENNLTRTWISSCPSRCREIRGAAATVPAGRPHPSIEIPGTTMPPAPSTAVGIRCSTRRLRNTVPASRGSVGNYEYRPHLFKEGGRWVAYAEENAASDYRDVEDNYRTLWEMYLNNIARTHARDAYLDQGRAQRATNWPRVRGLTTTSSLFSRAAETSKM